MKDIGLPNLTRHGLRHTGATWLADAGIPSGKVLGLLETLTSARARDADLVTTQPHPEAGKTHILASPYRIDGQRLGVRLPPPQLGADSQDVFQQWLGKCY